MIGHRRILSRLTIIRIMSCNLSSGKIGATKKGILHLDNFEAKSFEELVTKTVNARLKRNADQTTDEGRFLTILSQKCIPVVSALRYVLVLLWLCDVD